MARSSGQVQVRQSRSTVASFDIFDTVLTRKVGEPRAAFLLLGHRLAKQGFITCSAEAFARQRRAAEVRAFRNAGGLDSAVDLDAIYGELDGVAADTHASRSMVDMELQLESELLTPIPLARERLTQARCNGKRVVFVSDMYLSSSFLEAQLRSHELFIDGDALFVSNEHRKSKASGALWPHVLDELGLAPGALSHLGNDAASDGASPRKLGIEAEVIESFNLNRFEQSLERSSFSTDGLASVLAGGSRLARQYVSASTEHERAIRDVSAGVAAPFVIAHVLWTLRRAIALGIDRLYFVARDGQISLAVAKELAQKIGYTGELRYLYGSRQAWVAASLSATHPQALEAAMPTSGDTDRSTPRLLLHRIGLNPEKLRRPLEESGFPIASWDQPLRANDVERFRHCIASDPALRTAALQRAEIQREQVLGYLRNEGVVTSDRIAIVDQGTGGTLFNALSRILETVGQRPPLALYFGVRSDVVDEGFGFPEAFIRNERTNTGFLKTPGFLTFVEMVCAADHPSVVGYEQHGDQFEPELGKQSSEPLMEWGFDLMRQTIVSVARHLHLNHDDVSVDVDLREAVLDVFAELWYQPHEHEARAWGAYPFQDGWGSESVELLPAKPMSLTKAFGSAPHRHWWMDGTAALSSPLPKAVLRSRSELTPLLKKVKARFGAHRSPSPAPASTYQLETGLPLERSIDLTGIRPLADVHQPAKANSANEPIPDELRGAS